MEATHHLDGEPESRVVVDHSLAPVRLRIASSEIQRQDSRCQDDKNIACHTRCKSRHVGRRILGAENQRTRNTSNATQSSQSSGTERSAPLSTDIVGLVRHDGRNGAIRPADRDEHADVLSPWVLYKAHDRQADQRDETEEAHHWAASLVLITEPRSAVHHEPTRRIRWRTHALRHGNAEFEFGAQDNGEEESESVRDCRDAEENERKSVDVPLCRGRKELLPCERLGCDVAAVGVEFVDNEVDITGPLQKAPRWLDLLLIGELDDE